MGGEFFDTSPDVASGKVASIRITKKRAAHANLRDSSGVELGTVSNPVNVAAPAGGTAVTIANGADTALGSTTDPAHTTDVNGTVISFLRGLVSIFSSVWDTTNLVLNIARPPRSSQTTALTAPGQELAFNLGGGSTAEIEVFGSFTGVLNVVDRTSLAADVVLTVRRMDSGVDLTNITTIGTYEVNSAAMSRLAVTAVSLSAGTAQVLIRSGEGTAATRITDVVPGTAATRLGKADGGARSAGDTGVASFAVQNNTRGALSSDTHYTPLQTNASGDLRVDGSAVTQPVKTEVQADYDTSGGTQNLSLIGLALPASGGAVQGGTATNPLRTDPTGTTHQPVDQGTAAALGSAWPVEITDGGNVLGTSGHPVRTDPTGTTPQPVTETRPASTVTVIDLTQATDATRVLTILAANAARRGATIRNDTDAVLLVCEGGNASPANYTDVLPPGARWVLDYPASTGVLTAYLPQVPNGRLQATERA